MSMCGSKSFHQRKDQKVEEIKRHVSQLKTSLLPYESLLPLTELPVSELQARLCSKQLSPSDLLHAFQLKAVLLYQEGSSGICEFVREAEAQAQALTSNFNSFDSELRGIPISVKEVCCLQGYDATLGLLKLCGQPATEDCIVVKCLRQAGAIPFVLTATSHLALTISGKNPVFGDMHHPLSSDHEPGGSSTGEAVLLVRCGSPLGLGTDLAGSIRIPCAFCGLAGLKPTSTRLSTVGLFNPFPNSAICLSIVPGPMARRVDDLAKVMHTLLGPTMFQMDPSIPALPFNNEVYQGEDKSNLVIGYYDTLNDSDVAQTVPAVRRGIANALEILKQKGHRVVKFDPPEPSKALQLALRALSVDGGKAVSKLLSNEPLTPHTKALKDLANMPDCLRRIIDAIARRFIGRPAAIACMTRSLSGVPDLMNLVSQIEIYRKRFQTAWMQGGEFDAIICPVWAYPAFDRDMPIFYTNPPVVYTLLYNLLDYPAGVLPIGTVNQEDVENSLKLAEQFKIQRDRFHENVMLYQKNTEGLPLSVQVVSRRFREEVVLRVMRELETACKSVIPLKPV